jgi:hypothetical protein
MKNLSPITSGAYSCDSHAMLDILKMANYKDALTVAINIMQTKRELNIDEDTFINLKTKYKLYCFDLGIDTGYFKG